MRELLHLMYDWVQAYISDLYTTDSDIQNNILLKQHHTNKVVENCRALAEALQLSERDAVLAEMIGLFHDIGRFKQYIVYRTFNDRNSVNHALFGLAEIDGLPLLRQLPPEDLAAFKFAIANHNAMSIAPEPDERKILLARVIRDADKLDIFRVLEPRLLPSDGSGYSDEFAAALLQGRQCDYGAIKTLDDHKIVRLLWLYDIYFPWTLAQIEKRGFVSKIIASLPDDDNIRAGVAALQSYMRAKQA